MKRVAMLFTLLVFAGFGCAPLPTDVPEPVLGWVEIGEGIERYEDEQILLVRFAAEAFTWEFSHGDPKSVEMWADFDPRAAAVINGVYFHDDALPSGQLIDNGELVGDRTFDWDRTGVIELSPRVRILDTADEAFDPALVREAAQSYPILVKDGVANVSEDSGLIARRSVFGVDQNGRVYLGVVDEDEVSLFALAAHLASLEVEWDAVINLDGGPSSGLLVRGSWETVAIGSFTPVPNVIVATPVE